MTIEDLSKVTFTFVGHLSLSDEHVATYENAEYGIIWQKSARRKKNSFDFGKTRNKFYYNGKWYSEKRFYNEIIKGIEIK